MRIVLGMRRWEWEYYDRRMEEESGRYIELLWFSLGIRILNEARCGVNEYIRKMRFVWEEGMEYREIEVESFYYELIRSLSLYLGVEEGELIHYMVYCEMMGDGVGGESRLVA
jgi:hypothetical protein